MKNLLFILIVGLVALIAAPTQATAYEAEKQTSVEVVNISVYDAEMVSNVFDFAPGTCHLLADAGPSIFDTLPEDVKYRYDVVPVDGVRVNYAGFGAFLQTDADTESPELEQTENPPSTIWDLVMGNQLVILTFLLALSELLALIPGINQNGIFQSIFSFLKSKSNKRTAK